MPDHSRTLRTQADPDRVWEIWSDTSTWASWNPDVASMEPAGRLDLGREITMHTRAGRHHRMKVVEVVAGRRFALETSPMPLSTFTFTCTVEPADAGCVIGQSVSMRGLLGSLMSATGGDRVASGFEAVLEGLARAAEGGS